MTLTPRPVEAPPSIAQFASCGRPHDRMGEAATCAARDLLSVATGPGPQRETVTIAVPCVVRVSRKLQISQLHPTTPYNNVQRTQRPA